MYVNFISNNVSAFFKYVKFDYLKSCKGKAHLKSVLKNNKKVLFVFRFQEQGRN